VVKVNKTPFKKWGANEGAKKFLGGHDPSRPPIETPVIMRGNIHIVIEV